MEFWEPNIWGSYARVSQCLKNQRLTLHLQVCQLKSLSHTQPSCSIMAVVHSGKWLNVMWDGARAGVTSTDIWLSSSIAFDNTRTNFMDAHKAKHFWGKRAIEQYCFPMRRLILFGQGPHNQFTTSGNPPASPAKCMLTVSSQSTGSHIFTMDGMSYLSANVTRIIASENCKHKHLLQTTQTTTKLCSLHH